MSNLTNKNIIFPKSVLCEIQRNSKHYILWISGIFGTWFVKIPAKYKIYLYKNKLIITPNKYYSLNKFYSATNKNFSTTFRQNLSIVFATIKRLLWGAGLGFKKYLRVRGVGYKFALQKNELQVNVGFTHTIKKVLPEEFILKFSRKFKMLRFRSKSLSSLTSVLSDIRSKKKPDVYKGKGIRYRKEILNKKEGKKENFLIMPTIRQIITKPRKTKKYKNKTPDLRNCPQKKGTVVLLLKMSPRKPNSAQRKAVRCAVRRTKRKVLAYIPGVGHTLQKFANVLIRGGRVKDLPGMKYTLIRAKFDLRPVAGRRTARSIYGGPFLLKHAFHYFFKFYYT